MFRREIKKQFNESKYNVLTAKGVMQKSQLAKVPFQKHIAGSIALMVLGFNFTKRYMTFPHHHKDESKPMTLLNGELHPFEHQPPVSQSPIKQMYRAQLKIIDHIHCTMCEQNDKDYLVRSFVSGATNLKSPLFNSQYLKVQYSDERKYQQQSISKAIITASTSVLNLLFLISKYIINKMKAIAFGSFKSKFIIPIKSILIFIIYFTQQIYCKNIIGQFCQFSSECTTGCCYKQQCLDYNSCSILSQMETFEKYNYCNLDSECGEGSCCFDQVCMPEMTCLLWMYIPLFLSVLLAVIVSCIVIVLINGCIKKQQVRIKKELKMKKRKANKKRGKKEKKPLLDKDESLDHEDQAAQAQKQQEEEELKQQYELQQQQLQQQQQQSQEVQGNRSFYQKFLGIFNKNKQIREQPMQEDQKKKELMQQQQRLIELRNKYPQQFQKLMQQQHQMMLQQQMAVMKQKQEEEAKSQAEEAKGLESIAAPINHQNQKVSQQFSDKGGSASSAKGRPPSAAGSIVGSVNYNSNNPTPKKDKEEQKDTVLQSLSPAQNKEGPRVYNFANVQLPPLQVNQPNLVPPAQGEKRSILQGMKNPHNRRINEFKGQEGDVPHEIKR